MGNGLFGARLFWKRFSPPQSFFSPPNFKGLGAFSHKVGFPSSFLLGPFKSLGLEPERGTLPLFRTRGLNLRFGVFLNGRPFSCGSGPFIPPTGAPAGGGKGLFLWPLFPNFGDFAPGEKFLPFVSSFSPPFFWERPTWEGSLGSFLMGPSGDLDLGGRRPGLNSLG